MKSYEHDGVDLEDGKTRKAGGDKPTLRKIPNQALLSGLAYCVSSCSMILVNKFVLSSYNFNAGIFLMLYQVCIVHAISLADSVLVKPFNNLTCLCDVAELCLSDNCYGLERYGSNNN